MNNCPICDREFNHINGGNSTTIIAVCTNDTPYSHALHMEQWLTYNSLNATYGTNLNLPLPTMCTIVWGDALLTIQSWDSNKNPVRLTLKYKGELIIIDKGELSNLLDYKNLPNVIASIYNNIAFI
jgi:hypothetical protein